MNCFILRQECNFNRNRSYFDGPIYSELLNQKFPFELSRDITENLSVMGNSFPPTFPEDLLAHASPNDWPIVTKHANTSSRGSINVAPTTITSESFSSLC